MHTTRHFRYLVGTITVALLLYCLHRSGSLPAKDYLSRKYGFSTSTDKGNQIPVWTSLQFAEGFQKRRLTIPQDHLQNENKTSTHAVLHSVVVDYIGLAEDPSKTTIRVLFAAWDHPMNKDSHIACSRFLENGDYKRRFSLILRPDSTDPSKVIEGQHSHFWTHEMGFKFPSQSLDFTSLPANHEIPGELNVFLNETVVGTFPFTLTRQQLPTSRLAICMKPFFGNTDYSKLLEWREHHRMLGFDVVHFSHRHKDFGEVIKRLNAATGGRDTFRWKPVFEKGTDSPYWDESMMFDECYTIHRQTADWIGVWDMDEFFAPLPKHPWTSEWLEDWMSKLDPGIVSLAMPMTWVDRNRFGMIPNERLLAIDPTLSQSELGTISSFQQNANGVREWHDTHFHKSFHRTSKQFSSDIHYGWPGPETQTDPLAVVIYHARHDPLFDRNDYIHYPLNAHVVAFWKALALKVQSAFSAA